MGNRQPNALMDDASTQTYRYVRAAIIGSVLLLFVAVALQVIAEDWVVRGSISEYYYGPVRGVLVGILVATGLALVAIKGRPFVEETSLNLAGMLAPVVAFVPTPVAADEGTCPAGAPRCIPAEFLPGVENNMAALILVGPPILALAWWGALRAGAENRTTRLSLTGATLVWVGFASWFFFGPRHLFLEVAHYMAAVLMFALVIVVVWYNALRTGHEFGVAGRSVSYRHLYRVIAALMSLTLLAALVYFWATHDDPSPGFPLVFVLEAILLALFMAFWVAQTREFWDLGLPPEACEVPV